MPHSGQVLGSFDDTWMTAFIGLAPPLSSSEHLLVGHLRADRADHYSGHAVGLKPDLVCWA
jgi:hypothetical protein